MNLKNEFRTVREWAEEKGIYKSGDVKTQTIKLFEEAGELSKAIMNNDYEEFIDALGDITIVLVSIAELGNKFFDTTGDYYEDVAGDGGSKMLIAGDEIKLEDCINSAYDVIKSRTGEMVDGTFIKSK